MKLRNFAEQSGFAIGALVVEKGAAFLLIVLLARVLPTETYGLYSFIVAYLTLFQVLADFGLEPILVRQLSAPGADRPAILSAALGLRLGLALGSASLAVLLAPWVSGEGASIVPIVLLGCASLLFLAQPGFRALLRAELRLEAVFLVASFTATLTLAGVFLVSRQSDGLLEVWCAYAVATWAGIGFAALLVSRSFRIRVRISPKVWRSLLAESWPVGTNLLVLMLGVRAGALVLMQTAGPDAVGLYASAARLSEASNLLGEGAMLVIFPLLARLGASRSRDLQKLAGLTAKTLVVALCLTALVGGALSDLLIQGLFGERFAASAPVLAILLWSGPFAAVGTLYANLLVVTGHQRLLLFANGGSAAILILLQLLLVPRFGIEGAAVGVVVGFAAGHVLLLLPRATREVVWPCYRAIWRPMALALGCLMFSVSYDDGLSKALMLLGLFPLVLLGTGTLSYKDLKALREVLRDRASEVSG